MSFNQTAIPPSFLFGPPPPAAEERETVEQFLARGGVIEVLPPGEVSMPLERIGHD